MHNYGVVGGGGVDENHIEHLCEILIAEAKKVLLIIILKRKNLINIYFPHT